MFGGKLEQIIALASAQALASHRLRGAEGTEDALRIAGLHYYRELQVGVFNWLRYGHDGQWQILPRPEEAEDVAFRRGMVLGEGIRLATFPTHTEFADAALAERLLDARRWVDEQVSRVDGELSGRSTERHALKMARQASLSVIDGVTEALLKAAPDVLRSDAGRVLKGALELA